MYIYLVCLNVGVYSLNIHTWVSTDREYTCINLLFTGDPVPREVHLCMPCLPIFPLKGNGPTHPEFNHVACLPSWPQPTQAQDKHRVPRWLCHLLVTTGCRPALKDELVNSLSNIFTESSEGNWQVRVGFLLPRVSDTQLNSTVQLDFDIVYLT